MVPSALVSSVEMIWPSRRTMKTAPARGLPLSSTFFSSILTLELFSKMRLTSVLPSQTKVCFTLLVSELRI